ncbi:hypothetical protein Pmani_035116 [Petrolisthes manimaculis]|uniref:Uncharacterized protein n=1 Tax=Petrolisthes manimaculis TaxID=1843537 RepID=A0AAE1NL97_9EUCA|nr:hypothetical protein Pmani_035116 [Petrolisthes manimaculis]
MSKDVKFKGRGEKEGRGGVRVCGLEGRARRGAQVTSPGYEPRGRAGRSGEEQESRGLKIFTGSHRQSWAIKIQGHIMKFRGSGEAEGN